MKFDANLESMEKTQRFISDFCESNGVDARIVPKACVCGDEIFSNIIRYSGASFGQINLSVEGDGTFLMEFIDDGKPFNPLEEAPVPDVKASVEERKIGGLGIFMVRKLSRAVEYKRSNNLNVLIIKI